MKSPIAEEHAKTATRTLHLLHHGAEPTVQRCELIVANIIAAAVAEANAELDSHIRKGFDTIDAKHHPIQRDPEYKPMTYHETP